MSFEFVSVAETLDELNEVSVSAEKLEQLLRDHEIDVDEETKSKVLKKVDFINSIPQGAVQRPPDPELFDEFVEDKEEKDKNNNKYQGNIYKWSDSSHLATYIRKKLSVEKDDKRILKQMRYAMTHILQTKKNLVYVRPQENDLSPDVDQNGKGRNSKTKSCEFFVLTEKEGRKSATIKVIQPGAHKNDEKDFKWFLTRWAMHEIVNKRVPYKAFEQQSYPTDEEVSNLKIMHENLGDFDDVVEMDEEYMKKELQEQGFYSIKSVHDGDVLNNYNEFVSKAYAAPKRKRDFSNSGDFMSSSDDESDDDVDDFSGDTADEEESLDFRS